jgi:hypothetical protein
MILYVASVLTSFISVFVKIFQTKNVMGNHQKLAFFTSYGVAVLDVATINFIIEGGWIIAVTSGTGAAFGVVAAMRVHDRFIGGRHE